MWAPASESLGAEVSLKNPSSQVWKAQHFHFPQRWCSHPGNMCFLEIPCCRDFRPSRGHRATAPQSHRKMGSLSSATVGGQQLSHPWTTITPKPFSTMPGTEVSLVFMKSISSAPSGFCPCKTSIDPRSTTFISFWPNHFRQEPFPAKPGGPGA